MMVKITTKRPTRPDGRHNVMECRSTICEQKGDLSPKHLRYQGFVLAWTALIIFTIFLLVGLSLDVAKLCIVNHQLHIAADAGALAGGPWVKRYPNEARLLAQKFAAMNIADHVPVNLNTNDDNLTDGDIIIGKYGYFPPEQPGEEQGKFLFIPYDPINQQAVNALAVITSRDVDERLGHQATQRIALNFGSMVDVDDVDLAGNWQGEPPGLRGPYAIAITGGGSGSGLLCMRHDGTGFHIQGDSVLTVNNITDPPVYEDGAITINSGDDIECVNALGSSLEINVDIINIHAKYSENFDESRTTAEVWHGQPRMPDPLAWLNKPGAKPTDPALGLIANVLAPIDIKNTNDIPKIPIPPGYYPGGMSFKGGTVDNPIRLAGGIYILDGVGLQADAGAYIVVDPANGDADGDGIGEAFFYIAGSNWDTHPKGTCLEVIGNSVIKADPLSSGMYEGIIFAQDDNNLNDALIIGTGETAIEGTLYFPQEGPAEEQNGGNGAGFSLRLGGTGLGTGNQIITSSLYLFGTGDKIINYDGRNPSPISKSWLVG